MSRGINIQKNFTGQNDIHKDAVAKGNDIHKDAVAKGNDIHKDAVAKGNDIQTLAVQFSFELIPDCLAATVLDYTPEDRLKAEVLTGPVFDDVNFYYSAYSGNLFSGNFKSALFIARSKTTGALVYARNTEEYSLDTGDNYLNNHLMTTRTLPLIKGDKIYLTSGYMSNIGPQLFCLDKATGDLIYAIAYYLPEEVEEELHVKYITTKGDYSRFRGSNSRISTFNPMFLEDKCNGSILCGVSSLQNAFNVGLVAGLTNYIGYPYFTDQGFLFKISEDVEFNPYVSWRSGTCAPLLHVGDKVSKGCGKNDPFLPNNLSTVIATETDGLILSPVVSSALFAPFWGLLLGGIYLDSDKVTSYTLDQILPLLTVGSHTIYTNVDTSVALHIENTPAMGVTSTFMLWYTKLIRDGDIVLNKYDANGLNYWGNNVWGAGPTYDKCNGVLYYASGQTHSMPLDEILQGPAYIPMKQPLVNAADTYVANQTFANLVALNIVKNQYQEDLKTFSLLPYRSPRGEMSYCDGVFGCSPSTGRVYFAARSIPLDVYSFVADADPKIYFFNTNDCDGDASSGVFLHNGKVGFTTKNGCMPILDVSCLNKCKFNGDLEEVGVVPKTWVYTGPNGILGGSNYQSAQNKNKVFTVVANNQAFLGALEYFVTRDGLYVPRGNSIAVSVDLKTERVIWNKPLGAIASGSATYTSKVFLTENTAGQLFALNEDNGQVEWQMNSGQLIPAMKGGVASPSVDTRTGQVFWISSYDVPANQPTSSSHGYVFKTNACLKVDCKDFCFLEANTYTDHQTISNTWVVKKSKCGCKYYVNCVTSEQISEWYKVQFCCDTIVFILREGGSNLAANLLTGKFINKDSYLLTWQNRSTGVITTSLMSLV